MKLLETIFSVKNSKHHKIVTILGLKLKFFSTKLYLNDLKKKLRPTLKYTAYAKYQINKGMIDVQITKFKNRDIIGVNRESKRLPRIIVSLTTFPERIGDVHYAIYSLLNQTLKPDEVILWLAEEQFPDREEDLSQEVLDLVNHGVTIKYTKDLKSYKKIIPALSEYPEDILVTADDDIFYPPTWLEQLYETYLKNPYTICAHRVHKVALDKRNKILPFAKWCDLIDDESCSILNHPTTGGGILYPPHSLYKDVTRIDLIEALSPTCDESWLWAMSVLNKISTKIVKNPVKRIAKVNVLRDACFGKEVTLSRENWDANKKDEQLNKIVEYYPQILEILKEEQKSTGVNV